MDTEVWLALVNEIEGLSFVPVDNEIAVKSVELPGDFHPETPPIGSSWRRRANSEHPS